MNSPLSATLITDGVSEDVALIMPIQIRGQYVRSKQDI